MSGWTAVLLSCHPDLGETAVSSVHVASVAASSNLSSIASAIGRTVCISPDAVDVGEGSATEMLGRQ